MPKFSEPLVRLIENRENYPLPLPPGLRVPSRNPNAKVERQGHRYEVITWPQKMFDDSIVEFESVRGRSSVLVLPYDDEQLMQVETEQPGKGKYYGFIAGEIEFEKGESLHEACKRELLEEIGYTAEAFHVVYFHEPAQAFGQEFYIYTVIATGCKKVAEPICDPGEKCSPYYIDLDELIEETKAGKYRYPPRIVTDLLISGKIHRLPIIFNNPWKYATITYPNKE